MPLADTALRAAPFRGFVRFVYSELVMLPDRNAATNLDDEEETTTTEDTNDDSTLLMLLHLIDEHTDDDED